LVRLGGGGVRLASAFLLASLEDSDPLEFRSLLAMVEGFGDGLRRGGRGG
jgi:hypothetical protein